jgi:8-oxo-dGTP diphosphatase
VSTPPVDHGPLPYRIAVLCYLYDADGRVLLLHRSKSPNDGMYSPIGGKLEIAAGESPHQAAVREIAEEAGLHVADDDVRMIGIVSETAYEGETHWLIFLFEVMRPVGHDEIRDMHIDEGRLEWIDAGAVADLPIPDTDREIMNPLVREHRGGFFVVHIDCSTDPMTWSVRESVKLSTAP